MKTYKIKNTEMTLEQAKEYIKNNNYTGFVDLTTYDRLGNVARVYKQPSANVLLYDPLEKRQPLPFDKKTYEKTLDLNELVEVKKDTKGKISNGLVKNSDGLYEWFYFGKKVLIIDPAKKQVFAMMTAGLGNRGECKKEFLVKNFMDRGFIVEPMISETDKILSELFN